VKALHVVFVFTLKYQYLFSMQAFNFLDQVTQGNFELPFEPRIDGIVTVSRYDTTPSLLALMPALLRNWMQQKDNALFVAITARFSRFISDASITSDSYAHIQDHWNNNYCPFLNRYFRWLRGRLCYVETRVSPCNSEGQLFLTAMPSLGFLLSCYTFNVLFYAFEPNERVYYVVSTTRNSEVSIHITNPGTESNVKKTFPDCKSFFLEALEQDAGLPWHVVLKNLCDAAYAFLSVLTSKEHTTLLHQLPAPAVEQIVEALRQ